jgi:hypothetical protein
MNISFDISDALAIIKPRIKPSSFLEDNFKKPLQESLRTTHIIYA